MTFVNNLLRPLVGWLLVPLGALSPTLGVTLLSLLAAMAMLWVFRVTSDQPALDAVKRRIHACLFEMRLFNDDVRALFRAQGEILRHNVTYLRLSFAPMLWMLPPFVLAIAQLQFVYGYRGVTPGASVLVQVELARPADPGAPRPRAELHPPSGVTVDTPAVWIPAASRVAWRVTPRAAGDHRLEISVDGVEMSKILHAGGGVARRSPARVARGFLDELLYPAEPPLPADSRVQAIRIAYPEAEVSLLGWRVHWLVAFFLLSIVFAFALRKPFGVVI